MTVTAVFRTKTHTILVVDSYDHAVRLVNDNVNSTLKSIENGRWEVYVPRPVESE